MYTMAEGKSKDRWIILICLLLLVLIMVLFIKDKKEWGMFCGTVAILYAIISGKPNRE